ALTVARELALELLASLLRHAEAPSLVLVERQGRIHARDVVAPERIGKLARAEAIDAERFERGAPESQRRFERFALGDRHAAQPQLEIVGHVARTAEDRKLGKIRAHPVDERDAVSDVVDRI